LRRIKKLERNGAYESQSQGGLTFVCGSLQCRHRANCCLWNAFWTW